MNQSLVETKEVRTALPVRLMYLVLRLQPFERALKPRNHGGGSQILAKAEGKPSIIDTGLRSRQPHVFTECQAQLQLDHATVVCGVRSLSEGNLFPKHILSK
jgi:hypothetical protein